MVNIPCLTLEFTHKFENLHKNLDFVSNSFFFVLQKENIKWGFFNDMVFKEVIDRMCDSSVLTTWGFLQMW